MRNMHRPSAIWSAIVLSGVLSAPTAQAVDDKVFPAADCIKPAASGGTPSYTLDGRLANDSTTSFMTVVCPIVRDNTTAQWVGVRAVVIDQSTTANVCCRGHSRSADGNTGFSSPSQLCSTGNGNNGQTLNFGPIGELDNGYFFVACTIPPRQGSLPSSGVASYRISEP